MGIYKDSILRANGFDLGQKSIPNQGIDYWWITFCGQVLRGRGGGAVAFWMFKVFKMGTPK